MKKNLLTIIIPLLAFFGTSHAQFFQAKLVLDNSSTPAKVRFIIRANPGGGNITNIKWDRFEFFIRRDNAGEAPVFGDPVANTVQFPGLGILKGGFGIPFMDGWNSESGKTNYYFCSQSQASTTSEAREFIAGTEYEVFNVPIVSGNFNNFEFVADQILQDPFYMALVRNTAGIGGEANLTSSGSLAPPNTHVFYSGTLSKVGNVFIQVPGLLPVNFLSFYAMKNGDDAKLSWQVDGDLQNDYFEILRSTNGRDYKSIQKIESLENGQLVNSYETTDFNINKLGSREVFYQIKQRDKDGQTIKSPVRMLSVDGLGKAVTAFPNPAKTSTKLVVDAPEAGKGNIIMRDAIGRQVQVINAEFNRGINQFNLNVMNLSSGDYNIQVSGGGIKETIKLTKIN